MIGANKPPKGFTLFEIVVVLTVFSIAVLLVITIFTNASQSQRREAVSQKALADTRFVINSIAKEIYTQKINYHFYKTMNDTGSDCTDFGDATNDSCDLTNPVNVLALIDTTGNETTYWFDNGHLLVCKNDPIVSLHDCTRNGDFTDITPNSIAFSYVNFYISPTADPASITTTKECTVNENEDCGCTYNYLTTIGDCDTVSSSFCSEDQDEFGKRFCAIPNIQPTVLTTLEIVSSGLAVGNVRIPLQFTSASKIYVR